MKTIEHLSLCLSAFLIIFTLTVGLFLLPSVTDTLAQFPQLSIKDKNALSLNVTDAVYNANMSEFLGSKNVSLTPYRIAESQYFEKEFLNNVGNVTNSQTFLNTYLMSSFLEEERERLILLMDKISVGYVPT